MSMSVTEIKNINTSFPSQNQSFKNFRPSLNSVYFNNSNKINEKDNNVKVKIGVISAAILSTLAVLYGITKKKRLNPFKNFNMFKQEIEPLDMLKITGVSVPVSLITGMVLDKKENRIAKIREGISQMVGNLIIPIVLIDRTLKFKDKISNKKFDNVIMNTLKKTHKSIYVAASLVTGLLIGNIAANKINKCIFSEHKERPLKIKDFSIHLDDICFATSLIFKGNPLGKFASKLIPATLLLSAYETGTKDKHEI